MENKETIEFGIKRLHKIFNDMSRYQTRITIAQDRLAALNKDLTQDIKYANETLDTLTKWINGDRENAKENESGKDKDEGTIYKD